MGIFKTKKGAVIATAPEEQESSGEIKHIENLSNKEETTLPVIKEAVINEQSRQQEQQQQMEYREVPVCLSQAQINNLVIENNIMLKQIIAEL